MVVRKPLKSIFFVFVFFLLCAFPVFAASSTFLTKAQNYYNNNCNKRNISNQTSLECYVFDKVNELQTSLNSLTTRVTNTENKNTSQDTEIQNLKNRVDTLEQNQNPDPVDVVFFNGSVSPAGAESQVFDALKFSKVTFTYQGTSSAFVVQVSSNQSDWFTQYSRGEGENNSGGSVTLDSAGRYYKVVAGSTTLPANQVFQHALGHFFN